MLIVALVDVNRYSRYSDGSFLFKIWRLCSVSHDAANLNRQICVKRSAVGNEEMSALKYGIIYWAKIYQTNENESNWALAIDCLIALRHLNTRGFGNPAGLGVL